MISVQYLCIWQPSLRCMVSTVQFLTFLSITFIVFVFVYLTLPNGTTSGTTIIPVTVSDRAPAVTVLRALRPNDTRTLFGKTGDTEDYTVPNGTTIMRVTVSDRASVLPRDTMMISYGKRDNNDDYNDTSKCEVATYHSYSYLCMWLLAVSILRTGR